MSTDVIDVEFNAVTEPMPEFILRQQEIVAETSSAEIALVNEAIHSAGFLWMSATCCRLWLILAMNAGWDTEKTVEMTQDEFAARFRIGKRTIPGALKELESHGWLSHVGERGVGIKYQIKHPPKALACTAADKVRDRIDRKRESVDREASQLERDQHAQD